MKDRSFTIKNFCEIDGHRLTNLWVAFGVALDQICANIDQIGDGDQLMVNAFVDTERNYKKDYGYPLQIKIEIRGWAVDTTVATVQLTARLYMHRDGSRSCGLVESDNTEGDGALLKGSWHAVAERLANEVVRRAYAQAERDTGCHTHGEAAKAAAKV